MPALRKPYPPSMYCPCGSNKKYKSCCQVKGIEYFLKPGGKIIRRLPLTAEQKAAFDEERRKFIASYKREPTPQEEDLLRMSEYEDVEHVIAAEMAKSGMSPEAVYAFEKTGLLITAENRSQVSPQELERWEEAIEEYRFNQAFGGN